jgi:hypothetical protein
VGDAGGGDGIFCGSVKVLVRVSAKYTSTPFFYGREQTPEF